MKACDLFKDMKATYMYLERYVNDGSPSGFTDIRACSDETNPFIGKIAFPLLEFRDADLECIRLGSPFELFERNVNYAHPDSVNSNVLKKSGRVANETEFHVSPTSSMRTMMIQGAKNAGFLKLTYDIARIGRVDRQLAYNNCLSCFEITERVKKSIDDKKLPESFSILLDLSSKITKLPVGGEIYEWGVIYREEKPYPYSSKERQLVPGFSLFSVDRKQTEDQCLINQIIDLSVMEPREFLIDLLKMIVDCYWGVVLNCALHMECHAQNCLFEIDKNYHITRFVIRDMDSVDKDIPLARYLGINDEWESSPFMVLRRTV